MQYLIHIDKSTRSRMAQMAMPYLDGREDVSPLMRELTAILSARFPKRAVIAAQVPAPKDPPGRIRVMLVVDGALDQGVIFDRPGTNDEVDVTMARVA